MEDLACYRELWAKPADNIQDSYLYEFIFEACRFFSNKGYICDPSEIYSVLGRMGEVDIKRLLYAMIVHSSDQSEEFDPLYREFVSLFSKKRKRGLLPGKQQIRREKIPKRRLKSMRRR